MIKWRKDQLEKILPKDNPKSAPSRNYTEIPIFYAINFLKRTKQPLEIYKHQTSKQPELHYRQRSSNKAQSQPYKTFINGTKPQNYYCST